MKIEIKSFDGQHCETTATGALLSHININLSEPMLFGLGQGLGYGIFKFGKMSFPFMGGRLRSFEITQNICTNLGLDLDIQRTTSVRKAWNQLKSELDNGNPVGLQLDCYYLDYFTSKVHFAGHFVAMIGYDEKYAYLIDTVQQGKNAKTSLDSLTLARSSKQPMSDKNLSYTIKQTTPMIDLEQAIPIAIHNNAKAFLNPPIKNLGYKGIIKTADELKRYYDLSDNVGHDFAQTAVFMERAGTGGALFRNMYRDFLKESMDLLGEDRMEEAYQLYCDAASKWTQIAKLFAKAGETHDEAYLDEISLILREVADTEFKAMTSLNQLYT